MVRRRRVGSSRASSGPPDRLATPTPSLHVETVRERAVAGVAMVGLRGLSIKAIGFVVSIVLARILVPQDFGILAFGQTFVIFASLFTDGGVAGALIRRPQPPSRRELAAVAGFQQLLATAAAVIVGGIAVNFGTVGLVTTIIVFTLPLAVVRTPATVVLERNLAYRVLATVEVTEALVYAVVAVLTVALGAGVWGVAAALLVKTAVGSAVLRHRAPVPVGLPKLDWPATKPLLSFGSKYIAATALNITRMQCVNIATAAIAGVATLGYFNLAERILFVPLMLFETLGRVALPTVSRLIEAGEDALPDIRRALRMGGLLTGLMLVGLAGGAPSLIPGLFGAQWAPSVPVVIVGSLGFLLVGPISVAFGGFLYAQGEAGRMFIIMAAYAVVMMGLGLGLLSSIGVVALAVGGCAASGVEAALLIVFMRRYGRVSLLREVGWSTLGAIVGGAGGLLLTQHHPRTLVWGILAAVVSTVIYGGWMFAVDRAVFVATSRLALRSLRAAMGRETSELPLPVDTPDEPLAAVLGAEGSAL